MFWLKCIFKLGDKCRAAQRSNEDYVCTRTRDCKAFKESIVTRNYLDVCEFIGLEPIVCCPANKQLTEIPAATNNGNSKSADESMNTL
jgi:hypothetical protein